MNSIGDFPEFRLGDKDLRIGVVQEYLARYGYLALGFSQSVLDDLTSRSLFFYKELHGLPQGGADFSKEVAKEMAMVRCSVPDVREDGVCTWLGKKDTLVYAIVSLPQLGALDRKTYVDDPIDNAFSEWLDQSKLPIKFRRAVDREQADVEIGWVSVMNAGTVLLESNLAVADFPPCPNDDGITVKRILLNKDVKWFSGSGNFYDLQAVAMHEVGHVIGLGHSNTSNVMRETFLMGRDQNRFNLVDEDRAEIKVLYGVAERIGLLNRIWKLVSNWFR